MWILKNLLHLDLENLNKEEQKQDKFTRYGVTVDSQSLSKIKVFRAAEYYQMKFRLLLMDNKKESL